MNRDWFASAFGAAVEDIRAKLIDESFHGRRAGSVHHSHSHEHHQAQHRDAAERDIHGNEHGHGHGFER
jgi:hypothetical protein